MILILMDHEVPIYSERIVLLSALASVSYCKYTFSCAFFINNINIAAFIELPSFLLNTDSSVLHFNTT
jgi:hypothetical protein